MTIIQTQGHRDLHAQVPDPTRTRGHQHPLAGTGSERLQTLQGGQAGQRQAGRFAHRDPERAAGEGGSGHHKALGMTTRPGTPTEEGEDLVARLQRVDAGADSRHPPGRFPAADVGELDPAQASPPARILVSLGFRPAAWTSTSTSPGPGGSGRGQSSRISMTSAGPCRGTTAARTTPA